MGLSKKTREALDGLRDEATELKKPGISDKARKAAQARFNTHLKAANAALDKSINASEASIKRSLAKMSRMGDQLSDQVDMALDIFSNSPGLSSDVDETEVDAVLSSVMAEVDLERKRVAEEKAEMAAIEERLAQLRAFNATLPTSPPMPHSTKPSTIKAITEEDNFDAFCQELEESPDYDASNTFSLADSIEETYQLGLDAYEDGLDALERSSEEAETLLEDSLEALRTPKPDSPPVLKSKGETKARKLIQTLDSMPITSQRPKTPSHDASKITPVADQIPKPVHGKSSSPSTHFGSTNLINKQTSEGLISRAIKQVGKWFSQLKTFIAGEKKELSHKRKHTPTYSGPPITPQGHRDNLQGTSTLIQERRGRLHKLAQDYTKKAQKTGLKGDKKLAIKYRQKAKQARQLESKHRRLQSNVNHTLRECDKAIKGLERTKERVVRDESRGMSK